MLALIWTKSLGTVLGVAIPPVGVVAAAVVPLVVATRSVSGYAKGTKRKHEGCQELTRERKLGEELTSCSDTDGLEGPLKRQRLAVFTSPRGVTSTSESMTSTDNDERFLRLDVEDPEQFSLEVREGFRKARKRGPGEVKLWCEYLARCFGNLSATRDARNLQLGLAGGDLAESIFGAMDEHCFELNFPMHLAALGVLLELSRENKDVSEIFMRDRGFEMTVESASKFLSCSKIQKRAFDLLLNFLEYTDSIPDDGLALSVVLNAMEKHIEEKDLQVAACRLIFAMYSKINEACCYAIELVGTMVPTMEKYPHVFEIQYFGCMTFYALFKEERLDGEVIRSLCLEDDRYVKVVLQAMKSNFALVRVGADIFSKMAEHLKKITDEPFKTRSRVLYFAHHIQQGKAQFKDDAAIEKCIQGLEDCEESIRKHAF
mmetsp:Transcript_37081/g.60425  ORF Transcript_37081/g.60425 Transcript_37081/m.60425 type:complete len:431 (+) Transcript_37081:289-1581(+)